MAGADELGVDVQGSVEGFADGCLGVYAAGAECAVLHGRGQSLLPVGDTGEESNVLAGELLQGGEFLQRGWVALENVLQGVHGQDAVAGVAGLDGFVGGLPARDEGLNHGGCRVQGLFIRSAGLDLKLPSCDGIEGLLAEGVRAPDLVAGDEHGEDLHEPDRKTDPKSEIRM